MNQVEVEKRCDKLRALIKRGPGVNASGLKKVRGIIAELRAAEYGTYVNEKLGSLEEGFERWFSARKWKGEDDGQTLSHWILMDISKLSSAMDTWLNRGKRASTGSSAARARTPASQTTMLKSKSTKAKSFEITGGPRQMLIEASFNASNARDVYLAEQQKLDQMTMPGPGQRRATARRLQAQSKKTQRSLREWQGLADIEHNLLRIYGLTTPLMSKPTRRKGGDA
jgi:hypothetical protein